MILQEFDPTKEAIINAWDLVHMEAGATGRMPKVAVSCFEGKTFQRLVALLQGELIANPKNANGDFPVYRVTYQRREIAIFMMDMGAAGAGGLLEKMYALGVEKVVIFGSCGVLDRSIEDCSVIIPTMAVRDEGLSYHYAPPADEIAVNLKYIPEFTQLLHEVGCTYRLGKTWTTDAFYRETREKAARRKASGCICVDMECSALAAIAQFREKELFQFFYAADCLEGENWEKRSLSCDVKFTEKDRFAQLALELAVRISS